MFREVLRMVGFNGFKIYCFNVVKNCATKYILSYFTFYKIFLTEKMT